MCTDFYPGLGDRALFVPGQKTLERPWGKTGKADQALFASGQKTMERLKRH
jgi:hypothetical protein